MRQNGRREKKLKRIPGTDRAREGEGKRDRDRTSVSRGD